MDPSSLSTAKKVLEVLTISQRFQLLFLPLATGWLFSNQLEGPAARGQVAKDI
jgi:hypothetical protein